MARSNVFSRRQRPEKFEDLDPSLEVVEDLDPSPSMVESEGLHVLAVDDSLVDRKVIERLLKISSCKVTAVDSGRRALQFLGLDGENSVGLDGLKVNMVITDYCMPGMTGYELLKKIKESSTFREVPVVIMSSENVLARIDRCLEEGAEEFIVKPVKLSDVKRLKHNLTREEGQENEPRWSYKRKLQDGPSSLPSSPLSSSPSSSSTSTFTLSSPSSPESPSRRAKVASSE
ncbi:PREDICTED: two-component response regulator ARR5-like [Nelumbo nucifera]|uniref:Response regulatory domain-containing protein n=2 Tax=Nelumbo nucifera TaxID=4432 RepID=A0A822YJC3_NELNU|nr:PREDICTED: two-component response regulator ARR5-like [Nelumbo nucifera]DAD31075.1 TPA_asm: hypothetical protein HUJ06_009926 [Nelumbo nucifera]